jgi:hypothetical protein
LRKYSDLSKAVRSHGNFAEFVPFLINKRDWKTYWYYFDIDINDRTFNYQFVFELRLINKSTLLAKKFYFWLILKLCFDISYEKPLACPARLFALYKNNIYASILPSL